MCRGAPGAAVYGVGMVVAVSREAVLASRVRAQQLDRTHGTLADTAVLDVGVQDTGPDGARWALAIRGVDIESLTDDDLVTLWTIRGAPHVYRRDDVGVVAAATAPFSDADAGKRIYDASKPLREAGIGNLEALDAVASALGSAVRTPTVKGDASAAVAAALPEPYLRYCRPCDAVHLYEMPFRLAALRAGLELQPGTSPPVLRPIPGFAPADGTSPSHDVVRGYLRLLGPATPSQVAAYLDAPVKEVRARWPDEAVEVAVDGQAAWVLTPVDEIGGDPVSVTRLLGPFDLYLQARDRELLVPDPARRKELWPTLGRPGAVLLDGDIAGTWRPRKARKAVRVEVRPWRRLTASQRRSIEAEADRLADFRHLGPGGVDFEA
jgi:hypothetical protein